MSGAQSTTVRRESSIPQFRGTSRHPDCRPNRRVFIKGIEVPTVSTKDTNAIEVQMRKTGVSDIMRVGDCHIPIEWYGDNVLGAVSSDGLNAIGNEPVRIDLLDDVTDEYVTVHHGPISNIGSSTMADTFRILVTDWANYFENVSFDGSFTQETVKTVLTQVQDRLTEHEGLPEFGLRLGIEDKQVAENFTFSRAVERDPGPLGDVAEDTPVVGWVTQQIDDAGEGQGLQKIASEKSFHDFKHSCADVLNWVATRTSSFWYVQYDAIAEQPVITFDSNPTVGPLETYNIVEEIDEQAALRLIENNSLFQISPLHTLGLRGEKSNRRTPRDDAPFAATTVQPEVVVEHEQLAERAGQNNAPMFEKVDTTSLDGVKQQAKKMLKERIDDSGGGEMIATSAPIVRPYSLVNARPACNGRLERSVPPITYEVEEVIHTAQSPTQGEQTDNRTTIRCGVEATIDDITVRESREIELE